MAAARGAVSCRRAALPPGHGVSGRLPLRPRTRAAVALSTAALLAGAALSGCEYRYDDGWQPALHHASAAPRVTDPDVAVDRRENDPVGEPGLGAWLEAVQLGPGLQVAHRGYGLLRGQEIRTEAAAGLPVGTYVLALACRSRRPVTFTISTEAYTVLDLELRCGSRRQNVVYLSRVSALTFRVEAKSEANYAYRLIRL